MIRPAPAPPPLLRSSGTNRGRSPMRESVHRRTPVRWRPGNAGGAVDFLVCGTRGLGLGPIELTRNEAGVDHRQRTIVIPSTAKVSPRLLLWARGHTDMLWSGSWYRP